jgi:hypothetical protein
MTTHPFGEAKRTAILTHSIPHATTQVLRQATALSSRVPSAASSRRATRPPPDGDRRPTPASQRLRTPSELDAFQVLHTLQTLSDSVIPCIEHPGALPCLFSVLHPDPLPLEVLSIQAPCPVFSVSFIPSSHPNLLRSKPQKLNTTKTPHLIP